MSSRTHGSSVHSRLGSLVPRVDFMPPLAKKRMKEPTALRSPEVRDLGKERKEQEDRLRRLDATRTEKELGYLAIRPQHKILNNGKKYYSGVKSTSSYKSMTTKTLVAPKSFYTGMPKQLTLNEAEAMSAKQRREFDEWKKNPHKSRNLQGEGDNHVHYFYNSKGELVQRKWNDILNNQKKDYSGIKRTGAYKSMASKIPGMNKPYL